MNPVARLRQTSRTPFLQVVKTAVAAVAAWLLCTALFDSRYPIFAAIAALLVVQPSVNQSFLRGLERSAGVVLGVLLATALHLLLGDSTWIVLLVIVLAILLAWALRLTPGSSTQIPISAMLVLSTGATTPHYAVDRILETVIGALVALAVNALIVPPVLLRPAHLAVARLARDTASAFERIAVGLTEGRDRSGWEADLVTARTLRQAQARSDAAIAAARESLTMNPRGGRHRTILERDIELAGHLGVIVTRVIGMTRAIRDNATPDLVEDRTVGRIATEVARIAMEVRSLASQVDPGRASDGAHGGRSSARSGGGHGDARGGTGTGTGPTGTGPTGTGTARRGRRDGGSGDHRGSTDDRARRDGTEHDLLLDASGGPALTAPVTVLRPNEDHWILIGALLEDIRRVREELLGEGA